MLALIAHWRLDVVQERIFLNLQEIAFENTFKRYSTQFPPLATSRIVFVDWGPCLTVVCTAYADGGEDLFPMWPENVPRTSRICIIDQNNPPMRQKQNIIP